MDDVSNVLIHGNFFAKSIGNNLFAKNVKGSSSKNVFTKNLAVYTIESFGSETGKPEE